MALPFKDDAYKLPHYGRDGLQANPNLLEGWEPPPLPTWPVPAAPQQRLIPPIPVVPGLPWWVDPWMPPTPEPPGPGTLQLQVPSQTLASNSSIGRAPITNGGGLLGLLQDVLLQNEAQQRADGAGLNSQYLGLVSGKPMQFWSVQPSIHWPD